MWSPLRPVLGAGMGARRSSGAPPSAPWNCRPFSPLRFQLLPAGVGASQSVLQVESGGPAWHLRPQGSHPKSAFFFYFSFIYLFAVWLFERRLTM